MSQDLDRALSLNSHTTREQSSSSSRGVAASTEHLDRPKMREKQPKNASYEFYEAQSI